MPTPRPARSKRAWGCLAWGLILALGLTLLLCSVFEIQDAYVTFTDPQAIPATFSLPLVTPAATAP